MRPEDADGFRTAWPIIERRWAETVERARRLPPELLARAGRRGVVVHRDAAPPGDGDRRLGAARAARRPGAVPPARPAARRDGRPVRHGAAGPRRAAEPRRGAGGARRPDGPGRRGDRRPHRRAARRDDRAGARAAATRRPRATRCAAASARSSTRSGSTADSPSATSRRWRRGAASIARTRTCSSARRSTMSGPDAHGFNLSTVFSTVAAAVPDQEVLVWRDRRVTYAEMDARADRPRAPARRARPRARTSSATSWPATSPARTTSASTCTTATSTSRRWSARFRARVAPFNVNYRYVEEELVYLLTDARTEGAGLPRGVRADARRDPRPAARPASC